MKIKKISEIKNFGTYYDFQWKPECNEFKQFNFFYGWTYSGKTTLSRIFKCLEDKRAHPDFPNASFKLETDNSDITEGDIGKRINIRVFNEDFVEENFKWNDEKHEINPVLLLGKESIDLGKKVVELTKEKQDNVESKGETESTKESKEKQLDTSLTNKAREIREILGITNPKDFDRNVLENKIDEIKKNYKNYILSEKQYQSLLNTINITKQYEIISETKIHFKLTDFIDDVRNILNKQVTAQQIIQKFKDNPELNSWVRGGIDLHKNEIICQFCGNKLPPDLFDRLNKHFSAEFDKIIGEIKRKEEEIKNHEDEIKKFRTVDKARFFQDYQVEYEQKQESLEMELNNYIQSLQFLVNKLKEKRKCPFDVLNLGNINNNQETIEKIIEEINKITNNNNQKVQNLDEEKRQAKEKLTNHRVAKSIDGIKYFALKRLISIYNNCITQLTGEITKIQNQIEEINKQIKAGAIGAEKINVYLKRFFNDDKLKLKLLDDGKYQIFRGDAIAKNLSTGEKNIIALIYFFTRLEEKDFNLNQSIAFIDDPVSSLDSNHIFRIYGFLDEKLKNCGQLFITTHNFDFFNLLKDLIKGDDKNIPNHKKKKDKEEKYLIKKISNSNGYKRSVIENLPFVLKKFRSEYNYLFSILKNFSESNDNDKFELYYVLPNIARRFFEAYLCMKYPDGKSYKKKSEKFLEGENGSKKQSSLKLLDEYSHEESIEHSQKFPDINEIEDAVKFILETIEKKDKEHYEALCNSLQEN